MDFITPEMMELALQIASLFCIGLFGGLIRGMIGLYKEKAEEGDNFKFDYTLMGMSLVISGCIGIAGGFLLSTTDPIIILPLGYMGVDAAEGLFQER